MTWAGTAKKACAIEGGCCRRRALTKAGPIEDEHDREWE